MGREVPTQGFWRNGAAMSYRGAEEGIVEARKEVIEMCAAVIAGRAETELRRAAEHDRSGNSVRCQQCIASAKELHDAAAALRATAFLASSVPQPWRGTAPASEPQPSEGGIVEAERKLKFALWFAANDGNGEWCPPTLTRDEAQALLGSLRSSAERERMRREIVEECAGIADTYADVMGRMGRRYQEGTAMAGNFEGAEASGKDIASRIRALSERGTGE